MNRLRAFAVFCYDFVVGDDWRLALGVVLGLAGQLAGNHFATIVEGNEQLAELGRTVLWEGAQEISFSEDLSQPKD